jgi:hypothetical protein
LNTAIALFAGVDQVGNHAACALANRAFAFPPNGLVCVVGLV